MLSQVVNITQGRELVRALSSRHAADIVGLLLVHIAYCADINSILQTKERQNKLISWLNRAKISCPFASACRRTCFFLPSQPQLCTAANPSHALIHDVIRRWDDRMHYTMFIYILYSAAFCIIYCLWNRCGFDIFRKRKCIAVTSRAVNIVSVQYTYKLYFMIRMAWHACAS